MLGAVIVASTFLLVKIFIRLHHDFTYLANGSHRQSISLSKSMSVVHCFHTPIHSAVHTYPRPATCDPVTRGWPHDYSSQSPHCVG